MAEATCFGLVLDPSMLLAFKELVILIAIPCLVGLFAVVLGWHK